MRPLVAAPVDVDPVDAYGRLRRRGPRRPGVRLNMISSLDGAASLHGRSGALGGPVDRALFAVLRSLADVILVGAATMRAEGYGPVRLDEGARSRRGRWGLPAVPPIAVVTRACRLDWAAPFFALAEQRPLVITVGSAAALDRELAAQVAEVIVAGDREVDLIDAVGALVRGVSTTSWPKAAPPSPPSWPRPGLLDELCLTVSPVVAAGDAPRILNGAALTTPLGLELRHVLGADGYLFLRHGQR